MIRITTNKEIIEAIKTVEELKKVSAILRIKLGNEAAYLDHSLSYSESVSLNIKRGSLISTVLARYKMTLK